MQFFRYRERVLIVSVDSVRATEAFHWGVKGDQPWGVSRARRGNGLHAS